MNSKEKSRQRLAPRSEKHNFDVGDEVIIHQRGMLKFGVQGVVGRVCKVVNQHTLVVKESALE